MLDSDRFLATPTTSAERVLAEVLAEVVGVDQVATDSHFFDDLGANSLVMAHFCAKVRKREGAPSISMKDVYRNPTIKGLATAHATAPPATLTVLESPVPPPAEPAIVGSTRQFVWCGVLQLLAFSVYAYGAAVVGVHGYAFVAGGSGLLDIYLRSVTFGGLAFLAVCAVPVVAKWVLVGRWRAQEFPVWSVAYVRFWIVKALLHANPMVLFVGNPLYVLYLRALGARIGKGVTILSPSVPVCTDLLTIGAGTLVRKDAFLLCYRAHAGRIQTGPVTLGSNVLVGEKTVLDIDTSMGDGAQLGHTSALHSGEAVPAGERWHGSPARGTDVDYCRVEPTRCGTWRRAGFGAASLLQTLVVTLPLAVGGLYLVTSEVPALAPALDPSTAAVTSPQFYLDTLVLSLVVFLGLVVVGAAALFTVPRVLSLAVRPDRVYPLYGFHHSLHRAVTRLTNIKFYTWLVGDSSYIVGYLRRLGYDLGEVEQTGSNFGTEVHHDTPYLTSVGSGTMVADGLSVLNADYSSTSFRVSRTSIGAHNFLGNNIAYPSGGRTGENCLLATKVMVPLDGELREGVGLLGSPCFEIPRSVERDTRFDHLKSGEELRRRLSAKNRYNVGSMALFLGVRWLHLFAVMVLGLFAVDATGPVQYALVAAAMPLSLVVTAAYYILVERLITGFHALRPQLCSIYEPYFWWHERLWKVPDHYLNVFNGTPFKNLVWRALGVHLGSRVFDDGCYLTERTLTAIGDDTTLNVGSKVQCHSQEDGTFKSDRTTIGAGCTLGVGAFIHYGVTIGDGATIAADSFLMKGEDVPSAAQWGGNPAAEIRTGHYQRSLRG